MNENRIFQNNRLVAVEYRDEEGNLLTKYDLVTGKTTNYSIMDEDGNVIPDVTDMSDETIAHFAMLDTVEARLARIEAFLWPPPPDPDPDDPTVPDAPTWDEMPDGVAPPGAIVQDVDGITYRNVSGGTLAFPPSAFPGSPDRWVHLWEPIGGGGGTPPPVPGDHPEGYVGEWNKDTRYEVGDVVAHIGFYWRCKIAHGAEYQGTWAPGLAHTVWDKLTEVSPTAVRQKK